jgi:hypothetical protein
MAQIPSPGGRAWRRLKAAEEQSMARLKERVGTLDP